MEYKDYYKTLGVDKTSSTDEIKKAYRKLAMEYHPDRNPGDTQAEDKFKEINEAYQVLSDDDKRSHYDRLGSAYSNWSQGGAGPRGGFDWGQWGYGQPGGGPGGMRVDFEGDLGDLFGGGGGSFSDFFSQIFGMGGSGGLEEILRGQGRRQAPQTPQYQTDMVISLLEAHQGSTRKVGIGNRHFDVKVPKGAKTGTKLRLKGAGPAGPGGGTADVYLVIKVSPDPRFERKKENLYTEVFVDIPTAVLGGKVKVPTLTGSISLKIPEGTQSGQTFRLKGKGMPRLKAPSQHGDLFATVHVRVPTQLSSRHRELFEQLSKEI